MKLPGTDLFTLIRAMTQAEKRYFKVVASPYNGGGRENKYLKLFTRIERQKQYNEAELKNHFRHDPFLGKHFKKAKLHLYGLILSTLERFDRDEQSGIQSLLHRHRILFRKGLYHPSRKMLARAKSVARRQENFTALMEICEQERHLISVNREFGSSAVAQLPAELRGYMEQLKNIHAVWELQTNVFRLFTKGTSEAVRKKRKAWIEKMITKTQSMELSNRAGITLYNTLGTYYMQSGVFVKAQKNYLRALRYYSNPADENSVLAHAQISSNYISACFGSRQFDKVAAEVNRLLLLTEQYPHNKRLKQVQCYLCHTGMSTYISSGNFSEGIEFSQKAKINYLSGAILRDKVLFAFNCALLFFGAKNFRQSLSHINTVLNIPENTNPVPQTVYWSKILQLVVLYDNRDFELLNYRLKSTRNYFQKRGELSEFENIFLAFLKRHAVRLPSEITLAETKREFSYLRRQLKPLEKVQPLAGSKDHFDLLSWIDAKCSGKEFADVVKGK